ncbi:MAG: hypothetical protein K2X08_01845 [Chlamydiales bacterium]|nr:hypothetical protein [Chlamydiales bacterium]
MEGVEVITPMVREVMGEMAEIALLIQEGMEETEEIANMAKEETVAMGGTVPPEVEKVGWVDRDPKEMEIQEEMGTRDDREL